MDWETALSIFADSGQQVTQRGDVTKVTWAQNGGIQLVSTSAWDPVNNTYPGNPYDVWWWVQFTGQIGTSTYQYLVVGCNYNWGELGNTAPNPLSGWTGNYTVLDPLTHSPYQNSTTSGWSFQAAANVIKGVTDFVSNWSTQIGSTTGNGWLAGVNAPTSSANSGFSGSAASEFQFLINGLRMECDDLNTNIGGGTAIINALNNSAAELQSCLNDLYNGWWNYRNTTLCWPCSALALGLQNVMQNAVIQYDGKYGTPTAADFTFTLPGGGDPHTPAFWTAVDAAAKAAWTNYISMTLDPVAVDRVAKLDMSYQTSMSTIPAKLNPVNMPTPPPPSLTPNQPGAGNPKPGAAPPGWTTQQWSQFLTGSNPNNKGLNLKNPKLAGPGQLNVGPGQSQFVPPNFAFTTGGSNSLGTPTGQSNDVVIGPNGQVVDGPDGMPLMVPPGATINPDGTVTLNGKPVLGSNGQPMIVPKNSTLEPGGSVIDPATGKPVMGPSQDLVVPTGSTINADGTINGPDGHQVLVNGQPVHVPPGSTIQADGSVLGPNGKPIVESPQPLVLSPGSQINPNGTITSNGSLLVGQNGKPLTVPAGAFIAPGGSNLMDSQLMSNVPGLGVSQNGLTFPSTSGGLTQGLNGQPVPDTFGSAVPSLSGGVTSMGTLGTGLGRLGTVGTESMPGATDGIATDVMLGSNGEALTAGMGAAEPISTLSNGLLDGPMTATTSTTDPFGQQAVETAAQESSMMGRSADGGQPPLIPPMGGTPAGGPGGARQRTTWLSEDEDVWGTECDATAGVIGRPKPAREQKDDRLGFAGL